MKTNINFLIVDEDIKFIEAIKILNNSGLGMILVQYKKSEVGIFTDGDLRRLVLQNSHMISEFLTEKIGKFATKSPKMVDQETSVSDLLDLFENDKKVLVLPVADKSNIIGVIHVHDVIDSFKDA
jgi:arabinose-5-phosphate isomerase